jgi:hypothetical protein
MKESKINYLIFHFLLCALCVSVVKPVVSILPV